MSTNTRQPRQHRQPRSQTHQSQQIHIQSNTSLHPRNKHSRLRKVPSIRTPGVLPISHDVQYPNKNHHDRDHNEPFIHLPYRTHRDHSTLSDAYQLDTPFETTLVTYTKPHNTSNMNINVKLSNAAHGLHQPTIGNALQNRASGNIKTSTSLPPVFLPLTSTSLCQRNYIKGGMPSNLQNGMVLKDHNNHHTSSTSHVSHIPQSIRNADSTTKYTPRATPKENNIDKLKESTLVLTRDPDPVVIPAATALLGNPNAPKLVTLNVPYTPHIPQTKVYNRNTKRVPDSGIHSVDEVEYLRRINALQQGTLTHFLKNMFMLSIVLSIVSGGNTITTPIEASFNQLPQIQSISQTRQLTQNHQHLQLINVFETSLLALLPKRIRIVMRHFEENIPKRRNILNVYGNTYVYSRNTPDSIFNNTTLSKLEDCIKRFDQIYLTTHTSMYLEILTKWIHGVDIFMTRSDNIKCNQILSPYLNFPIPLIEVPLSFLHTTTGLNTWILNNQYSSLFHYANIPVIQLRTLPESDPSLKTHDTHIKFTRPTTPSYLIKILFDSSLKAYNYYRTLSQSEKQHTNMSMYQNISNIPYFQYLATMNYNEGIKSLVPDYNWYDQQVLATDCQNLLIEYIQPPKDNKPYRFRVYNKTSLRRNTHKLNPWGNMLNIRQDHRYSPQNNMRDSSSDNQLDTGTGNISELLPSFLKFQQTILLCPGLYTNNRLPSMSALAISHMLEYQAHSINHIPDTESYHDLIEFKTRMNLHLFILYGRLDTSKFECLSSRTLKDSIPIHSHITLRAAINDTDKSKSIINLMHNLMYQCQYQNLDYIPYTNHRYIDIAYMSKASLSVVFEKRFYPDFRLLFQPASYEQSMYLCTLYDQYVTLKHNQHFVTNDYLVVATLFKQQTNTKDPNIDFGLGHLCSRIIIAIIDYQTEFKLDEDFIHHLVVTCVTNANDLHNTIHDIMFRDSILYPDAGPNYNIIPEIEDCYIRFYKNLTWTLIHHYSKFFYLNINHPLFVGLTVADFVDFVSRQHL